ncbi:MAG: hypothetical protein J4N65_08980 [Chloroflexi bacterium]|nr:hypothetical protein [Chloroflexota bacterium]
MNTDREKGADGLFPRILGPLEVALNRLAANRTLTISVAAFLVNFYLVSAAFFPNLSEINAWDEATYVNGGRLLLDGQWPRLSNSPLGNVFYALASFPYADTALWLVHSVSLGRVVLFALLWISAMAVAWQLSDLASPLIMTGLLFVTKIPVSILNFPSDPLFVAFAALGFSQLLAFYRTRSVNRLWLASVFVGLSAMARNDGLILGVALIAATLLLTLRERNFWKPLLVSAAPFVILIGGYVLFYGLRTGDFAMGTIERTYDNFEAGHQTIYGGAGEINPVLEAKLEARRVFGTAEENRYSVFRAILRNPSVYLQRLVTETSKLPGQLLNAYGIRIAAPVFLFAVRGLYDLLRQKRYRLTVLFLLWATPILSGFIITIFRDGHLQFPFYLVYSLAAIGLTAAMGNLGNRREQIFWIVALVGFMAYGVIDRKPAVTYGVFLLLAVFVIIRIGWRTMNLRPNAWVAAMLLFFAGGIILHGDYAGPKVRVLGQAADERGVLFMIEEFPEGTRVAAGSPGPIIAANMTYMGLASLDVPRFDDSKEFLSWMRGQDIKAIYVDHSLSSDNPFFWELISSEIGQELERGFVADEGDIQVLFLTE